MTTGTGEGAASPERVGKRRAAAEDDQRRHQEARADRAGAQFGSDDAEWPAFIERIGAQREAVTVTAARIAELPSYRSIPPSELVPEIRRNYAVALAALRARRLPGADEDVRAYQASGERRARQGVTLADMLQGWTIGLEVSRAGAYREAPQGKRREALLLEAIEIMTAWNTLGMNAAAAAHRRIELELARQEQHDLANVVRGVLFGTPGGQHLGDLERLGVDRGRCYYAVRVRQLGQVDPGEIECWLGTSKSPVRPDGLAALIDGDVAGFIAGRPAEPALPVTAGLAGPVPLTAMADAFRLASRALDAACATGRRGLVDLGALGLIPAILSDEDVGACMHERYVQQLERQGRAGALVLDTAERYLRNDCQVHQTAAELNVHPNTVRYRVGRFEHATGCSLRHTESVAEAWWALGLRRIRAGATP